MKKLILIAIALTIPILIWWIEGIVAKRKGETVNGPSVLMLFGIALSIMTIIIGILLSQTSYAPSGSNYSPAKMEDGKIVPGEFSEK